MATKRILVLSRPSSGYEIPFLAHGKITYDANQIIQCDLVVFCGGDDVNPSLYGDKCEPRTHYDADRDAKEAKVYIEARKFGIPMTGICRGMQFLNVMSGGKLRQHVDGHDGAHHFIDTARGRVRVNSLHHQHIIPNERAEILAWSSAELGMEPVPEAAWWNDSQCLGVQWHPEMMNKDTDGYTYYQDLLKQYVL